jgi:spore germination cell wall hydrolase CwlJ-like protein
MRSISILFSILISTIILVFAFTSTTINKYNIPVKIRYQDLSKPAQKQIDCLTENIYFEAGHEPLEGKIAVALVTLNRLSTGFYGNDICGVVKQRTNNTCQFSWVCETKSLTNVHNLLYNDIRQLAVNVVMNYDVIRDVTHGATYYHADYVNPNWGLPKTTKIGRHIFYKHHRDVANLNKDFKL